MVATHEEKDIIVIYVDGFEGALEVDLVDKVEVYEEAVDIGGLRLVRVGLWLTLVVLLLTLFGASFQVSGPSFKVGRAFDDITAAHVDEDCVTTDLGNDAPPT